MAAISAAKNFFYNSGLRCLIRLAWYLATFSLKGFLPNQFLLNEADATLTWLTDLPSEGVDITYRVFPFRLATANRRFLFDSIGNKFVSSPNARKYGRRSENGIVDLATLPIAVAWAAALVLAIRRMR